MTKPSINWKLWRRMWGVGLSSYLLVFCTPWFLLLLSSGECEFHTGYRWYGIRAYWNPVPGWRTYPGCSPFRSKDEYLSYTDRDSWERGTL